MLDKLKIQNFQSHQETELNFSKGINLIIGETDSGKSGLIRVLNWIINNKPSGDSFRSFWGGTTNVSLVIDNETIKRKKGDKTNEYYYLGTYKAFKNEIPEYVKRKLNIGEINLQKQLDSPFLFSLSPGEVARYLNKIINLDVIDESMSNIKKVIRNESDRLKYEEERLTELKKDKKKLLWVKEAEKKLLRLEIMSKKIDKLSEKQEAIQNLLAEYQQIKNKFEKICKKVKDIPDINKVVNLKNKMDKIVSKNLILERLIKTYSNYEKEFDMLTKALEVKKKVFKDNFPDYCPMCGKGDKNGNRS